MLRYIQAIFIAVFVLFGVAPSPARAALLNPTGLGLLQGHLGENVNVTNIYTKSSGDTSADWHSAVDGKGRTFTLMKVTGGSNGNLSISGPIIIGGYNPQSWASSGGYVTSAVSDRTAFLFNLTEPIFLDQKTGFLGIYQTYNRLNHGPTFGVGLGGFAVNFDLTLSQDMTAGKTLQYSYGGTGTSGLNILSQTGSWDFNVDQVETYAISVVPLPPSAILFGTALFGMGAAGLRRNRKQAKKLA